MSAVDGNTGPSPAAGVGEDTAPGRRLLPRPGAGSGPGWQRRLAGSAPLLRRHWPLAVLLAAGLVLRVLAQIAYQPPILYIDTLRYLYNLYPGNDPVGYKLILKMILAAGDLSTVAAIQHLLGLAMAVALYVVLMRRGVNRWLAAIAVAPVLLDAYQLQMEEMIMPDVWFEAMIVAGLVVLLWRPEVTLRFVAAAGLILGAAAAVRQVGEVLILPALVFVLVSWGGWRRALTRSVALLVAFAIPILAYMTVSDVRTGHFWLARGQSSVGRMAYAADCQTLRLPAGLRPMCPDPAAQAHGPDWLEHSGDSPLYTTPVPPGSSRQKMLATFSAAVKHQQPARVVASALRDSIRLFAVYRQPVESVTPISRWRFQTVYPVNPPYVNVGPGGVVILGLQPRAFGPFKLFKLPAAYGGRAHLNHPVAAFLHDYQVFGGYTPGPLLLLFTLAGLAGSVLALFRLALFRLALFRRGGPGGTRLALACLLFTCAALVLLLVPDYLEFSWRYELPAVITLPPAGVLGLAALLTGRRRGRAGGESAVPDKPPPDKPAPDEPAAA